VNRRRHSLKPLAAKMASITTRAADVVHAIRAHGATSHARSNLVASCNRLSSGSSSFSGTLLSSRAVSLARRPMSTSVTSGDATATAAEDKPKKQKQQQKGQKGGKKDEKAITPKSEDFSRWYLDVIRDAQLADYGPVRGTMVIRPYGYALWEAIQKYMDRRFKEEGVQNAYFPQLIPYSFITKEASHVEGFSPELALVTKGGGKDLEEPLVVRPTSETIVNYMFSQWISSHRDLPMLVNQWANVHRWEMKTKPFVRTLEFLWQEGHTAHATAEGSEADARKMIGVYRDFAEQVAAMPVIVGRKSRIEQFAGANRTYTIEAMMGDKKALQAGTSHDLGQNFAKAFDTKFSDENQTEQYVHQSSWGVSTRLVGGVIMTHGDDMGLRLPPMMAPIQVVVVPIYKKAEEEESVMAAAEGVVAAAKAAGIRVELDADQSKTPGFKFNYWEMKGVPVRVEIGPRDVAKEACVVGRRDRPGKEGKTFGVPLEAAGFVAHVEGLLEEIQANLLAEATAFRDANIADVTSMDELKAAIAEGKWARCAWAGSDEQETQVKEDCSATIRCYPFDQPPGEHTCIVTGEPAEVCIFAKSY